MTNEDGDPVLKELVNLLGELDKKRWDYEIPVTLFIKGLQIAGSIVSADAYYREVASLRRIRQPGETLTTSQEIMNMICDKITGLKDKDSGLIFLKNAIPLDAEIGRSMPPYKIWRFRLSSIDGFIFDPPTRSE